MTNALAHLGSLDALEESLQKSAPSAQQHTEEFVGQFGGFNATDPTPNISPWYYGQKGDETPIHPDSVWVIDVASMQHGWMGFEPGPNGSPIPGQRPDTLFTMWNDEVPPQPADKSWMNRAYKWNAQCISSPLEGQEGVIIELSDWRKMSKGFGALERAVRNRVGAALRLRGKGQLEECNALLMRSHPVVQMKFNLQVKVKGRGSFNQAILKQLDGEEGWAGVEAKEAEPLKEASAKDGAKPARPARRRD